jgi:hypothetical protein
MPVNVLEHNADDIRLFPNPANEWLRLEGVAISDFIELIDVTGRRINTLSGQTSYQLDVSQLAEGVYFIRVLTQNGEYSKKVVVKK